MSHSEDDAFTLFLETRDASALERERFPVGSAGLHHERPSLRSPGAARLQHLTEEASTWVSGFPLCSKGHRLIPGAYDEYVKGAVTYKECKTCRSIRGRAAYQRKTRERMKRTKARKSA